MPRAKNPSRSSSEVESSADRERRTAARKRQAQKPVVAVEPARSAATSSSDPIRPGGKLGLLLERLATDAGATADELAAATGWQKHTVLGALSRLRSRGFAMRLETAGDRKAYRLVAAEA